jgi:hypothetical protein
MNPMDPSNFMPEDFERHIERHRQQLQEMYGPLRFTHSRSGMLARFLQRLADGMDPTGEARRRPNPRS